MKDNLPIEHKKGIFHKIFIKIKKIFFNIKRVEEIKEYEEIKENKKNQLEKLKVEIKYDNDYEKDNFMQELSDNPELLNNFSIKRLKIIKEYFENNVEMKKQKLVKLKNN